MLITNAFGQCCLMLLATSRMIFKFTSSKSPRLIPGFRATPAVTINRSDPAVVTLDCGKLIDIERFALHHPFDLRDVVNHQVAQLLLSCEKCQVAPDLTTAD